VFNQPASLRSCLYLHSRLRRSLPRLTFLLLLFQSRKRTHRWYDQTPILLHGITPTYSHV
jgi:hypothetical protein